MYKWQLKRRYNKIVEKLNALNFPHPGIDTFKFTDWFMPVLDETFEEIEIFWIIKKHPSELDKQIFDQMDITYRIACHRIKNDMILLTKYPKVSPMKLIDIANTGKPIPKNRI